MKKKFSKRFKKLLEISSDKNSSKIEDAISKVKKNCTTKFNESIDVSLSLNLKQKKDEFNLRTIVKLPNGNGKKIKVAVLCEESKITEAKKSGAELFDSNNLFHLTSLDLSVNKISDKGAIAIATSPYLSNLKKLDLFNNQISPKGLEALLQSKTLVSLEKLDVVKNNIDIESAVKLKKASSLSKLKALVAF